MLATSIRLAGKSADHTLYHAHPKGFWKKFRDALVVNPEISSGLPIPDMNRYPQPGSREERYATPATQASDVAFNPYFKRDTRRQFPATSVITQEKLAGLLLASPEGQKALPAPATQSTDITTTQQPAAPSLTTVLAAVPASFTSGGISPKSSTSTGVTGLPPRPPTTRWHPKPGGEVPHAPDAYWPMVMYK
ncbi:hypothetical protein NliqN6_4002 [Naganishia liquefaciens]|uniref:Uncharacterized protein n=1 Tax=Naganishia liquefaciens TaxID=104408 RepID=A0A8H3TVQ3_9TREE|nr:hypothetical protein NliqN6_4002 [Naganishia liquefaciens]